MFGLPAALGLVKPQGTTTYVNSVQQVTITVGIGATSNTATISAVGSRAFIVYGGFSATSATNPAISCPRVELTNSTTVTAYRNTSDGTHTCTVIAYVVDATSDLVDSVQAGTITITSATSNTASVAAVTNNDSVVSYLGQTSTGTGGVPGIKDYETMLALSGTTVTATKNTSTYDCTVGYQVIEFNGSALNQAVQNISKTWTTGTTTTSTITSVNTSRSMIFWAGNNTVITSSHSTAEQNIALTNSTTVTFSVNTSSANSKTSNCSVVEFVSGVLTSVQRSTTTLTTASSNTATISSVTTNKTAVNYLGSTCSVGTMAIRDANSRNALTDATTITTTRGAANGNLTASWEAVEFS